jgi:hypothetical protein
MSSTEQWPKMTWLDYSIESKENGDWRVEEEAFEKGLYESGDIFIVTNDGWLRKVDKLTEMCYKYDRNVEVD